MEQSRAFFNTLKGDDTIYKLIAINSNSEIVIHYPSPSKDSPHLNKLPLKEGLSQVENLSFSVYPDNPGYDKLFELSTRIKVIDIRDNTIRFAGRVLDISPQMDSSGKFFKDVTCEGALAYLNDTKTRAETYLGDPMGFVGWILNKHNDKIEDAKKIYPGNIDVDGSVAYTCNFDTTLNTLLTVKDKFGIGGNIRVREVSGVLYLDWLTNFTADTVEVCLGKNMSEMVKEKDVTSLGTRIIPLGANNLTIESVNGGIDYIEDSNARSLYGVIEKTVQYSDITDAQELYDKAVEDLANNTQPKYLLSTKALDLSFISGTDAKMFKLGTNLHLINPVLNVDDTYKIVSLDLDLLQPYNPTIEIANKPVKGSTIISDARKNSINNNSVHNGVQVGDDFGIRVKRSDGKVVTTLNATDGIKIENYNKAVFSVDENGNIVANDATLNDVNANRGIYKNITTENMIAEEMKTSNTSTYMILHDQYVDFYQDGDLQMTVGFIDFFGIPMPCVYGPYGLGVGSGGLLSLEGSSVRANGKEIATQEWVEDYVAGHMPSAPTE